MSVRLTVDGIKIEAQKGESILEASLKAGIYIPHLCFHPDLDPFDRVAPADTCHRGGDILRSDGRGAVYQGCGLCVVEEASQKDPVFACNTPAEAGMDVVISSPSVSAFRREKLAQMLAEHPHACLTCPQSLGCSLTQCSSNVPEEERCCPKFNTCELRRVAEYIGLKENMPRYRPKDLYREEDKPLFFRDYNLCIGCLRCVRVCTDVVGAKALAYVFSSEGTDVGMVKPSIEESGCVFCGACAEVCPTGAVRDKNLRAGDRKEALVPCRPACPLGMDVPRYVYSMSQDSLIEAAQIIRGRTPLALSLSYICHHPCESLCRRRELNHSIAICDLKRLALEDKESRHFENPKRKAETGKKIAVVGAGPAGLAASYYLSVLGHSVTIFEAQPEAGGMLRWAVPEFRLPRHIVYQDIGNIEAAGVKILTGMIVEEADFRKDLGLDRWDAVLLASGAQNSKTIEVEGSSLQSVYWGLDFLREAKEGRDLDLGQKVVVVGGGNVALAAGQHPDLSFLPGDIGVRFGKDLTIEVDDKTFQTDVPGLFAVGEAVSGPASSVEAMAMGRKSASAIDRFLGGEGLEEPGADSIDLHKGLLWREETDQFLAWERVPMAKLPPSERTHSFALTALGYSRSEGQEEASRCLRCHLRFMFTPVLLPPERWLEFEPGIISGLPESEGAFRLLDADKKTLLISGTPNLRQALENALNSFPEAKWFLYEEDPLTPGERAS